MQYALVEPKLKFLLIIEKMSKFLSLKKEKSDHINLYLYICIQLKNRLC